MDMGLYHFFWCNKERTVAVYQSSGNFILSFIDEEIVQEGLGKLSFTPNQPIHQLLQNLDVERQKKIEELLAAV